MCEMNWQLLLEYLKVLSNWPIVTFVIIWLLTTKFRDSINGLINRLTEGIILGQTLKAAPPRQYPEAGATEDRLTQAAAGNLEDEVTREFKDSGSLPSELANDPGAQVAVSYVKKNPEATVIEYRRVLFGYHSERLFNIIYGTQIALLEFLALRTDQMATLPLLAQFHREHQVKSGLSEYQLRDYVGFLVSYGVLIVEGPADSQEYKISQNGVEFLSYIKANYPIAWNQRAW